MIFFLHRTKWEEGKEEDEEGQEEIDKEKAQVRPQFGQFNVRAPICSDQSLHMEAARMYVHC